MHENDERELTSSANIACNRFSSLAAATVGFSISVIALTDSGSVTPPPGTLTRLLRLLGKVMNLGKSLSSRSRETFVAA
jgi:hypothetical protein